MATRVVEGKKPYTGGKAISIDENKVISLNLRDENNLIIYDEGDDEIYVDLQLEDGIEPTDAFPVGVNTGRVIVDNGWDLAGTIISAVTTSGDNIKLFYADEGTLWIDNGTGTFKQIYFKADVDALLLALRNYIDGELAKKQNGVSSDTAPSDPSEGDLWYDTTNSAMKVWDGTAWQSVGGGSDIVYATQAEYDVLPSSKLTDNKHYFIYSTSGGGGWQPGANTLAYYPLTTDANDYSGNNNNGTNYGVTFSNVGGVDCGVFTNSSTKIILPGLGSFTNLTMSVWLKTTASYSGSTILMLAPSTDNKNMDLSIESGTARLSRYTGISYNITDGIVNDGVWHHMVGTYTSTGGTKLYVDGVFINSDSRTTQVESDSGYSAIGGHPGGYSWATFDGNISNVIIETAERTAQEISDYFNQTKSNYGIS